MQPLQFFILQHNIGISWVSSFSALNLSQKNSRRFVLYTTSKTVI